MALNVWPNLTRAGFGEINFELTCRLDNNPTERFLLQPEA
jgi:hypothetical protein